MNPLIPPPIVTALVAALMWVADKYLPVFRFEFALQRPLAVGFLVAGVALMAIAVVLFVIARTTVNPLRPARASSLVTTGIFRLSRNPIYLGDLLLLVALGLWLGNPLNIACLALFVWYMNRFQIIPEERALTKLFGDSYVAYCAKVRRWL